MKDISQFRKFHIGIIETIPKNLGVTSENQYKLLRIKDHC